MHAVGDFLIGAAIGMSVIGFPMLERIRKLEARLREAEEALWPPLWSEPDCHVQCGGVLYDWTFEADV